MGGLLSGGGGGGGSSGATNQQPQAGGLQIYQPQAQPGFDQAYQKLLTDLYNPAVGGLEAAGNVTPAQQVYPQAQSVVERLTGYDPATAGTGTWGGTAVTGAVNALNNYAALSPKLQAAGAQLSDSGLSALSPLMQTLLSGLAPQAVNNIATNPYFQFALSGAQTGANIGEKAATTAGDFAPILTDLASKLPGAGEAAAATSQKQIPLVQGLASYLGDQSQKVIGQATALNPQLQGLFDQLVPQLAAGAQKYSAEAEATTPQYEKIGQLGLGLANAAPGLANRALGTSAGMLRDINRAGRGLMAAAPGFAAQELGLNAPLAGAENAILQTGFDPRSALYNRTQAQVADQAKAASALSGVGTSPYGASVTGKTLSDFNIDWQNQQLQRQAEAAQVAQGLSGQQASNITGAGGLLSGLTQAGAGLGLNVAQQRLANTQAGAGILSNLTQAGTGIASDAARGQLANTQAASGILSNLSQAAGGLGQGLTEAQINNLLGGTAAAGNLAAGAGNLATTASGLGSQGLANLLAGYSGAGQLAGQGLALGAGASELATQATRPLAEEFNQQQLTTLQALAAQSGILNQNISGLGALTNQVGAAGEQQTGAIRNLAQFSQVPSQVAQQQQQAALQALTQQLNIGNQQYVLPQQVLNALQSYLQLGQSASQTGGQLSALASQGQQNTLGNIGTLAGLTNQGLFGSSGLGLTSGTGPLGSGTPGLLSNLLGGGQGGLGAVLGNLLGGGGGGLLSWGEAIPFIV